MSRGLPIRSYLLATLDGQQIHEAERQLAGIDSALLIQALVGLVSDQEPQVRTLSLIHLRRILRTIMPDDADAATRGKVATTLRDVLDALLTFTRSPLLEKPLSKATYEVLVSCMQLSVRCQGAKSQLMHSVVSFAAEVLWSDQTAVPPAVLIVALGVMAKMAYWVHQSMAARSPDHDGALVRALLTAFSCPDVAVVVEASHASYRLIEYAEEPALHYYNQLLPAMTGALGAALGAGDEHHAGDILGHLIELGSTQPLVFSHMAADVLTMIQTIVTADAVGPEVKASTVELAVSICENAPKMVRGVPGFLDAFFPVLVEFMGNLDASEAATEVWLLQDSGQGDEDGADSTLQMAETAVDDIALSVGGAALLPIVLKVVPAFIARPEWNYRHAGIMAIGIAAEGLEPAVTDTDVRTLFTMVQLATKDPHPRVRWACMNTLGHMASDLGPRFREGCIGDVMECFLGVLADTEEQPRVRTHAAAAISNFCSEVEPRTMQPYLAGILHNLANLIGHPRRICRLQALTTLGDAAISSEHEFGKFYSVFMPGLLDIVRTSVGPADGPVRSRAVQTMTYIGLSVGTERFRADAEALIALLVEQQQTVSVATDGSDDSMLHYHSAYSGLAKVLRGAFAPYVDGIMPGLFVVAEQDASLKEQMPEGVSPDDVDVWDVGDDQQLYIRSAVFDEINSAIYAIATIFRQCPMACGPWVQRAFDVLQRVLQYYHADTTRTHASGLASAIAFVLTAMVREHGAEAAGTAVEMIRRIVDTIEGAYRDETQTDVVQSQIRALARIVGNGGDIAPLVDDLDHLLDIGQACELFVDIMLSDDPKDGHLFDEEDVEAAAEQNREAVESIVLELAQYYHEIIKVHGEAALSSLVELDDDQEHSNVVARPWGAVLLDMGQQWIRQPMPGLRAAAIVIAGAVVRYAPGYAAGFVGLTTPVALDSASDRTLPANLRQISFCMLAHSVRVFPAELANHVSRMISAASEQLAAAGSRAGTESIVSDNALSLALAVAECGATEGALKEELLSFWVTHMPPRVDADEIKVSMAALVRFLESNNPVVIGYEGQNLPKIFLTLVRMYTTDNATPAEAALSQRVKGLIVAINSTARDAVTVALTTMDVDGIWGRKAERILSG
ncbi:embryo defective emb2734 protein [Carpediemonas membranifera]|uniref:Embryo defective emb2734 protein n=1 Tax=Carpediemonas membranifera TaxID=201153 RepID=A0A8J6DZD2_9EUKA|nr:embryo defective emb2734 protein [Carpediemonas membranifera]|eukprot:KAG9390251.1 embryo defective emb2734 protein [Carpediemonas membranifera]